MTCRCRGATSTASTRRWSSCRSPTGPRSGHQVENQITAEDKHVVIIGGGDTGADCLGTAIRQEAEVVDAAGDHANAARRAAGRTSPGRRTR